MASPNLEVVRSIWEPWKRGDFSSAEWADADMELVFREPLDLGTWRGPAEISEGWRRFLAAWRDLRSEADEFRELDAERVLVLNRFTGRGRASGVGLGEMDVKAAAVFHLRNGKVTRLVLYGSRESALAELGI